MADKLFTFADDPKHVMRTEDMSLAIYEIEAKNWQKDQAAAKKDGRPFDIPPPNVDAIKEKYEGNTAEQALMRYATHDRLTEVPEGSHNPLAVKEAKALGAVLVQLEKDNEKRRISFPKLTVKGSDGKDIELEPKKELSGWLQASAKDSKTQDVPIDEWVKENNIGLVHSARELTNNNEIIEIETAAGQSRVVGNGVVTKPLDGYYGDVKGTGASDGDALDIYLSKQAYAEIKGGKTYGGPIFVMQQMDKGKVDELKVGYTTDVDEFRSIMTSTWDRPADFKANEGRYVELNQKQYEQLKVDLQANPHLTLDDFVKLEQKRGQTISDSHPNIPGEPSAKIVPPSPITHANSDIDPKILEAAFAALTPDMAHAARHGGFFDTTPKLHDVALHASVSDDHKYIGMGHIIDNHKIKELGQELVGKNVHVATIEFDASGHAIVKDDRLGKNELEHLASLIDPKTLEKAYKEGVKSFEIYDIRDAQGHGDSLIFRPTDNIPLNKPETPAGQHK